MLAALPERQRIATYLHHVHGLTHPEISGILGCKPATVGVHIHRGVKSIRDDRYTAPMSAGSGRASAPPPQDSDRRDTRPHATWLVGVALAGVFAGGLVHWGSPVAWALACAVGAAAAGGVVLRRAWSALWRGPADSGPDDAVAGVPDDVADEAVRGVADGVPDDALKAAAPPETTAPLGHRETSAESRGHEQPYVPAFDRTPFERSTQETHDVPAYGAQVASTGRAAAAGLPLPLSDGNRGPVDPAGSGAAPADVVLPSPPVAVGRTGESPQTLRHPWRSASLRGRHDRMLVRALHRRDDHGARPSAECRRGHRCRGADTRRAEEGTEAVHVLWWWGETSERCHRLLVRALRPDHLTSTVQRGF
ncbi:sigma-70 region 4 domain-containing protein [Streptomyces sp. NPDC090301]|uniref:sigma-70 region 4 domain-containing protein n=1 Tax=Streptomyces sp. NPDC090301 TaxID=3154975 RepID=UPI003421DAB4